MIIIGIVGIDGSTAAIVVETATPLSTTVNCRCFVVVVIAIISACTASGCGGSRRNYCC